MPIIINFSEGGLTQGDEKPHYLSMKMNGFQKREIHGVPYYSCRAFEEISGLCHGFSTRHGRANSLPKSSFNLSPVSWDVPERINENRRRFLSALRLEEACLVTLHQTHSDRVFIIKESSGQWNRLEGDALATQLQGIALGVQIADCLPILIADPFTMAVAAVHSGWRGTLAGIFTKTVFEMQKAFRCDPAQLLVAVGPGIRACCFEVGMEVVQLFDRKYPGINFSVPIQDRQDKYLLDLVKVLEAQFWEAGISPGNAYDLGICTCCNTGEFFSYRAEGELAGRMMAAIGRTDSID